MVRPRSCRVIYYFDTPTLGKRHQSLGKLNMRERERERERERGGCQIYIKASINVCTTPPKRSRRYDFINTKESHN